MREMWIFSSKQTNQFPKLWNYSFKWINTHYFGFWYLINLKYTKALCVRDRMPYNIGSWGPYLRHFLSHPVKLTDTVSCGETPSAVNRFIKERQSKFKTSVVMDLNRQIFKFDLLLVCSQHYLPHNICVQCVLVQFIMTTAPQSWYESKD